MSLREAVRDHVNEHRSGVVFDLAFAVGWVVGVDLLLGLLRAPLWAHYLTMAAGVVAYFGFVASLSAARATTESDA